MKYYEGYDDYELLYQIKNCDEKALEIFVNKYQPFIEIILHKYNVPHSCFDDYKQEANLLLLKVINIYDSSKNKTFLKFYELVLQRELYRMLKKCYQERKYDITYEIKDITSDVYSDTISTYQKSKIVEVLKSDLEKTIYLLYFSNNCSVDLIAKKLCCDKKKVYNAICRIKKKIKTIN